MLSPDCNAISSDSDVDEMSSASGTMASFPVAPANLYTCARIRQSVASNDRAIAMPRSISARHPGWPKSIADAPLKVMAQASGDPMRTFPMTGSPSARSIMRWANRWLSTAFPASKLAWAAP